MRLKSSAKILALGLLAGCASAFAFPNQAILEKQCNSGDMGSCAQAANGFVSEQNYASAANYLNKLCYSNHADALKGCEALTNIVLGPNFGINDVQKGMEISEYSCNKNLASGCLMLSNIYFLGENVKQDLEKSKNYAKKACALQDPTGCSQLALLTYTEAYSLRDINKAREAFKLYEQACSLGDQGACDNAAQTEEKLQQFELFTADKSK